jgi:hypothetical protein
MTVLELMIVLAIIGLSLFLVRSGFRTITKADLVDDSTELATMLKRTSTLAIEHGELYRVTFDFEQAAYLVEVCHGDAAITRNEKVRPDEEETKRALDRGKDRMQNLPGAGSGAGTTTSDPEEATRQALALAGHHIADRTCVPADDAISPDSIKAALGAKEKELGSKWARLLTAQRDKQGHLQRQIIKFKQICVQHRDDCVTKGQVAVYFFPTGRSEKAVIELSDDSAIFSLLVYGLTGRVELRDSELRDVNDHMMRNALGDRDAKRESSP